MPIWWDSYTHGVWRLILNSLEECRDDAGSRRTQSGISEFLCIDEPRWVALRNNSTKLDLLRICSLNLRLVICHSFFKLPHCFTFGTLFARRSRKIPVIWSHYFGDTPYSASSASNPSVIFILLLRKAIWADLFVRKEILIDCIEMYRTRMVVESFLYAFTTSSWMPRCKCSRPSKRKVEMGGIYLLDALRTESQARHAPICFFMIIVGTGVCLPYLVRRRNS